MTTKQLKKIATLEKEFGTLSKLEAPMGTFAYCEFGRDTDGQAAYFEVLTDGTSFDIRPF